MKTPAADRSAWALLALALISALPAALHGGGIGDAPAPAVRLASDTARIEARLAGPYGLWIRHDGDTLEARWFTRTESPGFLEIEGASPERLTTPSSILHTARFPRPSASEVVFRYGAEADPDDHHELLLRLPSSPRRSGASFPEVDSLFVVGDVHGELDNLRRLLANAGLTDAEGRWTGGRAHLVLLGDLMDRGPDVTGLLWFVYGLEGEAAGAGGRVHVVLGNHELMVMMDDLRYLHEKERLVASLHSVDYSEMYDVEESVLGRWLATKPGVLRIGRVLMAHGGLTTDYLQHTIESLDDTLSTYMSEELFRRWSDTTLVVPLDSAGYERRFDFFWGDESPFWFREYVRSDGKGDELRSVLTRFGSDVHVVAHTPVETIQQRYGRSLIAVHPRVPASEMLLLVRDGPERRRYRYTLVGRPVRLR